MDGKSLNITEDIISRLKQIIPGAFSEGKLNIDQLKQIIGEDINTDNERYELSWAGKNEAYKILQTPTFKTLKPELEVSTNWDSAENILIEGENLKVLKILQKSYYGKVKLILIDPPYNTGSDSFIYPDKFSESKEEYLKKVGEKNEDGYLLSEGLFRPNRRENGQYHSNWLSMMLPRIFLARNLLKDDGALIVHIDEHEQSNLELLLDEVFGEENMIGNIIWDKGNPKGDAAGIAYQHESILVYAKNKDVFFQNNDLLRKKKNVDKILKKARDLYSQIGKKIVPDDLQSLKKTYSLSEEFLSNYEQVLDLDKVNIAFKAWLKKQNFSGGELAYNSIDKDGNVYRLVSMAWPNKKRAPDDYFVPLIHPVLNTECPIPSRGWRYPTSTMKELIKNGEIVFGEDATVQPQRKYLLKNNQYENIPSILFFGGSDDARIKKLGLEFENPKPVEFTKSFVQSFTNVNSSDIILDFFAGSGTTAQAVLEANAQDKGNRRFITIQLPEKIDEKSEMTKKGFTKISQITLARITSILKTLNENAGEISSLKNENPVGVRFFKLSDSNFKIWRGESIKNKAELAKYTTLFAENLVDNSNKNNVLWELLLKLGYQLNDKVSYFELVSGSDFYLSEDQKTILCLNNIDETCIKEIIRIGPKRVICLDTIFLNNDSKKTNFHLIMSDNNIDFKSF